MKELIIVWSGGFDSTAVLLESAQDASKFDKVKVISCELKNANPECTQLDREARDRIRTNLKDIEPFNHYIWTDASKIELIGTGEGSGQASVWAHLAAMSVSINTETEIRFGYIRGDDFWHGGGYFVNAISNLCWIEGKNAPTVSYPFEWKTKKDILLTYVKYPSVFPHISWGGDAHETKLKEKDDLQKTFDLMMDARKVEPVVFAIHLPAPTAAPEKDDLKKAFNDLMDPQMGSVLTNDKPNDYSI